MSTTSTLDERRERIDELLRMIAGLEVSIISAKENADWDWVKSMQPLKSDYLERLRRVMYGLPEKRTSKRPPED